MHKWMWILIFLAFLGIGLVALDPDYGWHVAMGKYILVDGIPKTDPFSYTMPSYPFVDHEWLLNILMYWGEVSIGKNGLAVIFALVTTGALYLVPRKKGWELGVILAVGVLAFRGGVRPQVLDWFLVAVLWRMWQTKYKWWLPVIFLVWVNLHGGFAIGILMWLFMVFVKTIEDKKLKIEDWTNWLASCLATFVNPYGWRIWWEVWMQISDRQLRQNINEWQPFYVTVEPAFWFLAVLIVMFIYKQFKERNIIWWRDLTLFVLLTAGISSLRHVAIFAVVATIVLPEFFSNFWISLKKTIAQDRAVVVYKLFLMIAATVSMLAILLTVVNYVRGAWNYPDKAIEFLKSENRDGNILSDYGWGGYLIWKYPEKKVFIDGRMPSWRWPPFAPLELRKDLESENAMEDYIRIVKEVDYKDLFEKFNINYILVPTIRDLNTLEKLQKTISNYLEKLAKVDNEDKPNLVEALEGDGWIKIYEDETAVILTKN